MPWSHPPPRPPGPIDRADHPDWRKWEKEISEFWDADATWFPPRKRRYTTFHYEVSFPEIPDRGADPTPWERTPGSKVDRDGVDYVLWTRRFPQLTYLRYVILTVTVRYWVEEWGADTVVDTRIFRFGFPYVIGDRGRTRSDVVE
jgi:hypothetical protein